MEGQELEDVKRLRALRGEPGDECVDKHDGTFDLTLVDNLTGRTAVVNLTCEELAEGLRVAILGDDSEEAYSNEHIKSLQAKLAHLPNSLSFIP